MGLLVKGTPLDWPDALEWLQFVSKHGIEQFIQTYDRVKHISGDVLKWGDELEYGILELHRPSHSVRLSLRGSDIIETLMANESADATDDFAEGCTWLPEYGAWMVEATPRVPYGGSTSDLHRVETNMRLRRARILSVLTPHEIAPTLTCFPLLGVRSYQVDQGSIEGSVWAHPHDPPQGPVAQSHYLGDDVINQSHPRFKTLTANIRQRRGRKIDIRVPLFMDVATLSSCENTTAPPTTTVSSPTWYAEQSRHRLSNNDLVGPVAKTVLPAATLRSPLEAHSRPRDVEHLNVVQMDCMAFGMGMCCLQVTFQAKNVDESRHLYDHLGVLSPIFLALTAATPILRGHLVDTDVRWATISASVDDRTPEETGLPVKTHTPVEAAAYTKMAGQGVRRLQKSRYEGISCFIANHDVKDSTGKNDEADEKDTCHNDDSTSSFDIDRYNDLHVPYDETSYATLLARGIDASLALHIAHLFVRDPLVIYQQHLHLDDATETDHFENIQSTNWQTVRWKPPPPASTTSNHHVGWRTEFRSMEIQVTDFENAAFSVFLVLVTRVILAFDLNLYIPLSKVEANMEIAHRREAVTTEKFYFRCHLAPPELSDCSTYVTTGKCCAIHANPNGVTLMTVAEIMSGKGNYYPGLIPLVRTYLEAIACGPEATSLVSTYLNFIEARCNGTIPTTASWIRSFVTSHPAYQHDSLISSRVAYDLSLACHQMGVGEASAAADLTALLGDFASQVHPIKKEAAYAVPLTSPHLMKCCPRLMLLRRYTDRCD